MYNVQIVNKAKKYLSKLPKKDSNIILNKIYSIRKNPFHYLKRLKGSKLWQLKIPKYRAIVDVIVSGRRIIVLRVSLRKKIYDSK